MASAVLRLGMDVLDCGETITTSTRERSRTRRWARVMFRSRDENLRDERLVQRVAGGADGADGVAYAVEVEGFAQAPDMDVDGAGFDINIAAPYRVEQLLAAEDAARMLDQVIEQLVFGGAEVDFFAAAADAVCGAVHFDVADLHDVLGETRT